VAHAATSVAISNSLPDGYWNITRVVYNKQQ